VTCFATEESVAEASGIHAEIRVETISDYQEFLDLEPVWNEVAERPGRPSFSLGTLGYARGGSVSRREHAADSGVKGRRSGVAIAR
jgi:hypothetical protein